MKQLNKLVIMWVKDYTQIRQNNLRLDLLKQIQFQKIVMKW